MFVLPLVVSIDRWRLPAVVCVLLCAWRSATLRVHEFCVPFQLLGVNTLCVSFCAWRAVRYSTLGSVSTSLDGFTFAITCFRSGRKFSVQKNQCA